MELVAREEGKPISALIQDAVRISLKERQKKEFYQIKYIVRNAILLADLTNSIQSHIIEYS
ncbi:MAG: hypothetical protein NT010_13355 [Proteobacteria bacterium]|nr:hypothetical protein [Pseudomonadota bacterium]